MEDSASHDDCVPDLRDGLTRRQRVVLTCLHEAQAELGDRPLKTAMIYGRVVEHVDMGEDEFQDILRTLL